jgi:hypothetical protein
VIKQALFALMYFICSKLADVVNDGISPSRCLNLDETVLLRRLPFFPLPVLHLLASLLLPLLLVFILGQAAHPAFLGTREWTLRLLNFPEATEDTTSIFRLHNRVHVDKLVLEEVSQRVSKTGDDVVGGLLLGEG